MVAKTVGGFQLHWLESFDAEPYAAYGDLKKYYSTWQCGRP